MTVKPLLALLCGALLVGCASGPAYQKPALDMPTSWQAEAPWREGRPDDASAKGPWWQRYGDAQLDALVQQALAGSHTLAVAAARLAQARAALGATSASLLPQIGLNERAARQRISANRPLSNYNSQNFATVQNDLTLAMSVSYELDLAGRVQRGVEGAQAQAQQAAADLENTRLLLLADLATAYFSLRSSDAEIEVLGRAIALQQRTLALVEARRAGGAATGLDLAQQQAQLETTQVQLALLKRQRGTFEHAVATLAGVPAPQFTLAPGPLAALPPPLPAGVPSDVLERRPDIAAAERAMAAANAQIGVASAAYFPSLMLGGNVGVDSRNLGTLFDAPSLLWSFGLSAAQTLFDGGRISANVEAARAAHAAATASYRRVVLVAMQEVEDGLGGLAALAQAAAQADAALASARRVDQMTRIRYDGGVATAFDVITAQQALLAAERQATQLRGQRLLTSVFLVKALGGDWQRDAAAPGAGG